MDPGAAPSFLHADAMWEALGLDRVTGKPYNRELWQHNLMARTPYGKYTPTKKVTSAFVNEFFSEEGGFSLETYLERYRTLDDCGDVLPAVGTNPAGEEVWGRDGKRYKVGSRITSQALLARIKVCRPTHVVLNIGKHFAYFIVCAAMLWPLKRPNGRRICGVRIGSRRRQGLVQVLPYLG